MDEIVAEFLVESNENLDQLDRDLVGLEKDPTAREMLASVFRTIHTIKGTSSCLGFTRLEKLAHAGEGLLSSLRDGRLVLNAEITSALLAMADAIRGMLSTIEETESDGEEDYAALIEALRRLQETAPSAGHQDSPGPPSSAAEPQTKSAEGSPASGKSSQLPEGTRLGEILVQSKRAEQDHVTAALEQQQQGDPRRIGEILVEYGAVPPSAVVEGLQEQKAIRTSTVAGSIRVDVGQLDRLMNLVGELVLVRNQILQSSAVRQDAAFLNTSQRLNLITTALQEGVMITRMQPISTIWNKFPRIVRDLAAACDKQVRLEMEGEETELDKTIIEAIKDPLTHIVRNSIDHGIESREKRIALGKPAEGRLLLRAFHEGGQVNIEISDDGAGIDLDTVKRKGIERGLISLEQAARMTERETLSLVFLPGFSTAAVVTSVSGRGVGMDVVKTNVEKIGGTIDLQSRPGEGTTLKFKIPLTLAIIPALMVTSGANRYAIPQASLLELVRLEGEQARRSIELIHGAPVYRLREGLLPLVYLDRVLEIAPEVNGRNGAAVPAENGTAVPQRAISGDLDFAAARDADLQWKAKLNEHLAGSPLSAGEDPGKNGCPLGQWLYSGGLSRYGYLPEVRQLESSHAAFHAQIGNIIAMATVNQFQAAGKKLAELDASCREMLSLLASVEQRLAESYAINIVVLQADQYPFGLVVDEVNDSEEIVVKPLGKYLKGLSVFAGATILGDGRVALILDVLELARRANVLSQARQRMLREETPPEHGAAKDQQTLLLFTGPGGGRMAIPLSFVTRLEEFPRSAVEKVGSREAIQYRGGILPLVSVSSLVAERRRKARKPVSQGLAAGQTMEVVVVVAENRSIGLVVEQILDVASGKFEIQRSASRSGTVGSAVIQGKITEILDAGTLLGDSMGSGSGQLQAAAAGV